MTNVSGNIDDATFAPEHGQIFWEGFKVPVNALLQHIQRHAFDLGQIAHGQFTVAGTAWRNREAAVANDGCGHTHGGRGPDIRIPRDLCVKVGIRIDDAWHQRQSGRVNLTTGGERQVCTHGKDATLAHRYVLYQWVVATAVVYQGLANEEVCLVWGIQI